MLKRIYENYGLSIKRIINKEYDRLGLTINEAIGLIALFSVAKTRSSYSNKAVLDKVEYDEKTLMGVLSSLSKKGFYKIELIESKGKVKEVLNLDQALAKIERLILEDVKKEREIEMESAISVLIQKLEIGLNKTLAAYEVEKIRNWFQVGIDENLIFKTTEEVLKTKHPSIAQIDRQLMIKEKNVSEVDPQTAEFLEKLYKKIKWVKNQNLLETH